MTSSTLQTHGNTPSQRQITVDSQSQSTNYSILSDLKSPSAKSPRLLAPYDAEQMQLQMETFLHEEIYSSAKILGEFLISLASNSSSSGSSNTGNAISSNNQSGNILGGGGTTAPVPVLSRDFHAKSFSLFADLLVAMKEYKRAIQYYKRYWKTKITSNSQALTPEAMGIKVKIAKCWIKVENIQQAMETLNSIPSSNRLLNVNLLLGKIYLNEGLKSKAEEAYTMALRQNPYALEAAQALAELAGSKETTTLLTNTNNESSNSTSSTCRPREIEKFYTKLASMRASTKFISRPDAHWMQTFVNAHLNIKRSKPKAAIECLDALEKIFPHNLHCLLFKGKLEMEQEQYHQAHVHFTKARQVDDQNLEMMDSHADCLRRNGARTQLNGLVHEMFELSTIHAESWLAAAYFSEMKGEKENALQFSERAILTNGHFSQAYLFRGVLLLEAGRPEHALVSFTASCKITKTLDAYIGIAESYCQMCRKGAIKYKEALTTAKTIIKLYPNNRKAYTLLGQVFALRPEGKEQAKKAYQKALSFDPHSVMAIFGLVDLLVQESNFAVAIEKLVNLSEQNCTDQILTKLADVYTLNKQFSDAMTTFHRALSLNPTSEDALKGLDRLEKLMRGEDPDEMNSTMDQMEPEDNSMETSDYMS